MANRYGLDIKIYKYSETGALEPSPLASIPFANEVSLELSSELTWATGGQSHSKMISFKDPIEGTFKISTQIVNMQLMALIAGNDLSATGNKVSFKNDKNNASTFYIIQGETVWTGEDGTAYSEKITCYKACVKPNYSVTYNGSGDPQSLDVEFELGTNADGNVVDIERADAAGE